MQSSLLGGYMQFNRTCPLVEQYLNYLIVMKGRSRNTINEYRTDSLMFFSYVCSSLDTPIIDKKSKSISLKDIYSFIC